MDIVDSLLTERAKRYGSYSTHCKVKEDILKVLQPLPGCNRMQPFMRNSVTMIVEKLVRICNGDPYYWDSWQDIQGYVQLVRPICVDDVIYNDECFAASDTSDGPRIRFNYLEAIAKTPLGCRLPTDKDFQKNKIPKDMWGNSYMVSSNEFYAHIDDLNGSVTIRVKQNSDDVFRVRYIQPSCIQDCEHFVTTDLVEDELCVFTTQEAIEKMPVGYRLPSVKDFSTLDIPMDMNSDYIVSEPEYYVSVANGHYNCKAKENYNDVFRVRYIK